MDDDDEEGEEGGDEDEDEDDEKTKEQEEVEKESDVEDDGTIDVGSLTGKQKEVYDIVLKALKRSKPVTHYPDFEKKYIACVRVCVSLYVCACEFIWRQNSGVFLSRKEQKKTGQGYLHFFKTIFTMFSILT